MFGRPFKSYYQPKLCSLRLPLSLHICSHPKCISSTQARSQESHYSFPHHLPVQPRESVTESCRSLPCSLHLHLLLLSLLLVRPRCPLSGPAAPGFFCPCPGQATLIRAAGASAHRSAGGWGRMHRVPVRDAGSGGATRVPISAACGVWSIGAHHSLSGLGGDCCCCLGHQVVSGLPWLTGGGRIIRLQCIGPQFNFEEGIHNWRRDRLPT